MSTDPNQPPVIPGPRQPGQPAAAPTYATPAAPPQQSAGPQQSAAPQQPAAPAYQQPNAERSLTEKRPEILIGAAVAAGFVAAQLLGRIRGR